MQGYIVISQKPDGGLAYVKCGNDVKTPQQAVEYYRAVGRWTPVSWAWMEKDQLVADTKHDVHAMNVAVGRIITGNVLDGYVAVVPDEQKIEAPITTPGPRKPQPVICPEVWAKPREGVDYMAAVRAMCGDAAGRDMCKGNG